MLWLMTALSFPSFASPTPDVSRVEVAAPDAVAEALKVQVLDEGGLAVPGASIFLGDAEDPAAVTDDQGRAVLHPGPGAGSVRVEHPSFQPERGQYTLEGDAAASFTFSLRLANGPKRIR